nr:ABC transporter ATP-binding protein [bacterium]
MIIAIIIAFQTYVIIKEKRFAFQTNLDIAPIHKEINYYSRVLDDPTYANELRMYSISNWIIDKYYHLVKKVNQLATLFRKKEFIFNSGVSVLSALQKLTVYVYLAWQVIFYDMSFANFTMSFSAIQSILSSIKNFITGLVNMGENAAYLDAYLQYMLIPNEIAVDGGKQTRDIPEAATQLQVQNVFFRYPGGQEDVLQGIDLSLEKGKFYVVVGVNGAGKSTLVMLLSRLYDPTQGKILYNGVDIRQIDYKQYRSLFAVVFQNYKYYQMSIAENIAMEAYDASPQVRDKIIFCLQQAGLYEKVAALPKGIDTTLGRLLDDEGMLLSGGETQKLALAKALFKQTPIIILDEPSAALDAFAEDELIQTFNRTARGKTVLYISHRLSVARYADKVIFIDGKKIAGFAPHEELLRTSARYADMYQAQARHYRAEAMANG